MPTQSADRPTLRTRLITSRRGRGAWLRPQGLSPCETLESRLSLAADVGTQGLQTLAEVIPQNAAGNPVGSIFDATRFVLQSFNATKSRTDYFLPLNSGAVPPPPFRLIDFGNVVFDITTGSGLTFSSNVGGFGEFKSTLIEEGPATALARQFKIYGQYTGNVSAIPVATGARIDLQIFEARNASGTLQFPVDPPATPVAPVIAANDIGCTSEPRVYVIDPLTNTVVTSFLAYDRSFRGGVRVGLGDVDGDGVLDIVTAPGPGRSGGEVKAFRIDPNNPAAEPQRLANFSYVPFGAGYRGGIELSVGNLNGEGADEIVVAASMGPGLVKTAAFDGVNKVNTLSSFTAFASPYKNGATVAVAGYDQVVVGNGSSRQPLVKTFNNVLVAPKEIGSFSPRPPSGTGGVSVSTQNFVGPNPTQIQTMVAGGSGAGSATGVFQNQSNPAINSYKPFATSARPNAPVYAGGTKVKANPDVVNAVFMAQGSGGTAPLTRLDAAGNFVSFIKYNFVNLAGPLRVATKAPTIVKP